MNGENTCRICRIKKRKNFNGYGFNLESKSESRCRYIGIVDSNSPASSSGLRGGDKIIEINNINIEFFNHEQIVRLIKEGLRINDKIFIDEVLLTVKNVNSNVPKPTPRTFREPKFLKNLNFNSNNNNNLTVDRSFKSSKSMESLINKKNQNKFNNFDDNNNEPEIVIFI